MRARRAPRPRSRRRHPRRARRHARTPPRPRRRFGAGRVGREADPNAGPVGEPEDPGAVELDGDGRRRGSPPPTRASVRPDASRASLARGGAIAPAANSTFVFRPSTDQTRTRYRAAGESGASTRATRPTDEPIVRNSPSGVAASSAQPTPSGARAATTSSSLPAGTASGRTSTRSRRRKRVCAGSASGGPTVSSGARIATRVLASSRPTGSTRSRYVPAASRVWIWKFQSSNPSSLPATRRACASKSRARTSSEPNEESWTRPSRPTDTDTLAGAVTSRSTPATSCSGQMPTSYGTRLSGRAQVASSR
jgi:hypothetical protein